MTDLGPRILVTGDRPFRVQPRNLSMSDLEAFQEGSSRTPAVEDFPDGPGGEGSTVA